MNLTEVRHGASQPISLRRSQLYLQHAPDAETIRGLWAGSKNDNRRCVVNLAMAEPGDGEDYQILPEDRHVKMDTTTSIATATLPSPDDINDGHTVTIEDHGGNATANNITIATPGAEATEVALLDANDELTMLRWDKANSNWIAIIAP